MAEQQRWSQHCHHAGKGLTGNPATWLDSEDGVSTATRLDRVLQITLPHGWKVRIGASTATRLDWTGPTGNLATWLDSEDRASAATRLDSDLQVQAHGNCKIM